MATTEPYSVIVCDCPWAFADKLPGVRGAESHYKCLSVEDLCKLELPPIADDAIIFFWRVASMQEEALAVLHMLGFTLKSELVWVKTKKGVVETAIEDGLAFGMGHYTRAAHEVCLIGTKGRGKKLIADRAVRSVFFAPRGEHSAKPEEFYSLVEKLTEGSGPRLELFARRQREGWSTYGDEIGTPLRVIT